MVCDGKTIGMCPEKELKLKTEAWKVRGETPPWESKANDIQHGGTHYKQFKGMEPWDVVIGWGLGYLDGTALKYIARWKHKNGIEDLKKAIHFLEKAIEVYGQENTLGKTKDY